MIARMLRIPPDKNRLHDEQSEKNVQQSTRQTTEVSNILDHICNDTDLHPYVKQHRSKKNGKGALYAIHSRWLGLNHVNTAASEAKKISKPLTYGEVEPDRAALTLDGQGFQELWTSKGDSQPSKLRDSFIEPLRTLQVMVPHASVATDSHVDMCLVGYKCLDIHDHSRPDNVYSYDPKDGQRSAKNSQCHSKVSRSTEWTEVCLINKPSY